MKVANTSAALCSVPPAGNAGIDTIGCLYPAHINMKTPEQRLKLAARRLMNHRHAMAAKGFKSPQDELKERRLTRAYRKEVENGC